MRVGRAMTMLMKQYATRLYESAPPLSTELGGLSHEPRCERLDTCPYVCVKLFLEM